MEIRELPVDDLVLDQALNLRDRLDAETIDRYDEAWDRLPPVTVFDVDGRFLLADGFHRHATALRQNKRTISAEVKAGTFQDALDYAAGVNLSHGLPLTRAERRRAVETRLRIHPDWSDRRLSDEMGVGRELISRVRKELAAAGQIPASSVRVGADGKTYPSAGLPRDPNEHLPRDKSAGAGDDPRDRGGSEADSWGHANDPMPPARDQGRQGGGAMGGASGGDGGGFPSAPWDDASAKVVALSPPVAVAAPAIDEMLDMMSDQIRQMLNWIEDPEFAEMYGAADYSARSRFDNAVRLLDTKVDQLSAKSGRSK